MRVCRPPECWLSPKSFPSEMICGWYLRCQVIEETGLDVSGRLVQSDFIEVHVRQQRSKLFIITGVSHPREDVASGSCLQHGTCCFHLA